MPVVDIEDISALYGKELTDTKRARAELDLDAVVEILEGWARQKFDSQQIVDEEHVMTGSGVFLRWGEPTFPLTVKLGSPSAEPREIDAREWNMRTRFGYTNSFTTSTLTRKIYVTYTPDTSPVEHFRSAIKRIVANAVIAGLMQPEQVRYKVITNYSVEGLSVTYGNGSNKNNLSEISFVDLASLAPLRRNVIL